MSSNSYGGYSNCSELHNDCDSNGDDNGMDNSNKGCNLDSSSNSDKFCRYIEYLRTHYSITDSPNNPDNDDLMMSDDNSENCISHINTNDNNDNPLNYSNIDSNNSKSNSKIQGNKPTNKAGNAESNISLLGLNRYVTLVIIPLLERHESEKNKS
jgi:hypothetical protein